MAQGVFGRISGLSVGVRASVGWRASVGVRVMYIDRDREVDDREFLERQILTLPPSMDGSAQWHGWAGWDCAEARGVTPIAHCIGYVLCYVQRYSHEVDHNPPDYEST